MVTVAHALPQNPSVSRTCSNYIPGTVKDGWRDPVSTNSLHDSEYIDSDGENEDFVASTLTYISDTSICSHVDHELLVIIQEAHGFVMQCGTPRT
jgi:hypothetical protein